MELTARGANERSHSVKVNVDIWVMTDGVGDDVRESQSAESADHWL